MFKLKKKTYNIILGKQYFRKLHNILSFLFTITLLILLIINIDDGD